METPGQLAFVQWPLVSAHTAAAGCRLPRTLASYSASYSTYVRGRPGPARSSSSPCEGSLIIRQKRLLERTKPGVPGMLSKPPPGCQRIHDQGGGTERAATRAHPDVGTTDHLSAAGPSLPPPACSLRPPQPPPVLGVHECVTGALATNAISGNACISHLGMTYTQDVCVGEGCFEASFEWTGSLQRSGRASGFQGDSGLSGGSLHHRTNIVYPQSFCPWPSKATSQGVGDTTQ